MMYKYNRFVQILYQNLKFTGYHNSNIHVSFLHFFSYSFSFMLMGCIILYSDFKNEFCKNTYFFKSAK